MLTPLQLRLCGLSAMAPALTEAASQAQNFKLPYNTGSAAVQSSSPDTPAVVAFGGEERDSLAHDHLGLLTSKRLAVKNKGQQQHHHLCNSKEIHALNFTSSLVGLRDLQPNVDSAVYLTPKTKSNLTTIGIASELCLLEKDGEGRAVLLQSSASPCTMNSSNTNLNSLALDTMGMLKTASNLKFDGKRIDQCTFVSSESGGVVSAVLAKGDVSKEMVSKNRLVELTSRQVSLERRADCLLRRIQKLSARQVEKYIGDQLSAFVGYQQKALQLPSKRERLQLGGGGGGGGSSSSSSSSSSTDIKAEILQSEDVKSLSTAALVSLVRKLESSRGSALRQKYVTLHQIRSVERVESTVSNVKLPKEVCNEMVRVAGTLQSNLRHLESAVDSDATASSSGGESCDEMDGYDETKKTHSSPINKRAAWKWAVDRASVASRWTWLQAQVSDLEYRIRQQNEIYRQLRASKAPLTFTAEVLSADELMKAAANRSVVCPNSPVRLGNNSNRPVVSAPQETNKKVSADRPSEAGLSLLSSTDGKSLLTNPAAGRLVGQMNGYINPALPTLGGRNGLTDTSDVEGKLTTTACVQQPQLPAGSALTSDTTCTASRTRPLKSFRKRKLLRTVGLYHVSRKAAKLSSVRCGCLPPVTPCIMCGGRINNVQLLDPDTMSFEERVGLLDPSYHPVLSLEQDIPLSVHFESLMKNGEWQKTTQKPKPLTTARKKARLAASGNDVQKHTRKLKKNATATLTAKLKKKLTENKRNRGRGSALSMRSREGSTERLRKKHIAQISVALKKQRERSYSGSSGSSSKPASPVPSLQSHDTNSCQFGGSLIGMDNKDPSRRSLMLQDASRRRRGESAFDINNIVIPYSMAAATRVERLQYKEILTPKWRLLEDEFLEKDDGFSSAVHKNNGLVPCKPTPEESQMMREDLADDAISVRHDRCEQEEKKRFMSYVQTNWNTRGRSRNMRSDSRADSSGANTPDPMSPYQMEHHDSPLTTPPSTPAPVMIDENSSFGASRRRTTSLSRRDNRMFEDIRCTTPEIEEDPIAPWDLRTFPLLDNEVEEMMRCCPQTPPPASPAHSSVSEERQMMTASPVVTKTEPVSRPHSPMSTSSASVGGEDPNDPEWTVSALSAEKGPRPGIVIKLAKR